jgi:hypothetical protein
MPSSVAWPTLVLFGAAAWGLLFLGASGKIGGKKTEVIISALAVLSALIAGVAAMNTWINDVVGWFMGLHMVTHNAALLFVVLSVGATIPVLLWDFKSWVLPIAAAWVFLPSALAHGAVLDQYGGDLLLEGVVSAGNSARTGFIFLVQQVREGLR